MLFRSQVEVELTLLSTIPAKTAEIIVNGRVHTLILTVEASNKFSFHARTTLTLDSSSWIAARYLAPHGDTIDLAHTSPIYFWNQNLPLPTSRADAEYLVGRVDSLIREARAGRNENVAIPPRMFLITPKSATLHSNILSKPRNLLCLSSLVTHAYSQVPSVILNFEGFEIVAGNAAARTHFERRPH